MEYSPWESTLQTSFPTFRCLCCCSTQETTPGQALAFFFWPSNSSSFTCASCLTCGLRLAQAARTIYPFFFSGFLLACSCWTRSCSWSHLRSSPFCRSQIGFASLSPHVQEEAYNPRPSYTRRVHILMHPVIHSTQLMCASVSLQIRQRESSQRWS